MVVAVVEEEVAVAAVAMVEAKQVDVLRVALSDTSFTARCGASRCCCGSM